MSSGRVHAKIAWGLFLPLAIAGIYLLPFNRALGAGCMSGALAGVLITPDIDLEGITYEERRIYRLLYPLGLLWQWLWWPYGAVMQHRGLSHAFLLGTLTRLLYLVWVVIPVGAVAIELGYCLWTGSSFDLLRISYAGVPSSFWWGLFLAWAAQDAAHIIADKHHWRVAMWKRRFRPRHALLAVVAPGGLAILLYLFLH